MTSTKGSLLPCRWIFVSITRTNFSQINLPPQTRPCTLAPTTDETRPGGRVKGEQCVALRPAARRVRYMREPRHTSSPQRLLCSCVQG